MRALSVRVPREMPRRAGPDRAAVRPSPSPSRVRLCRRCSRSPRSGARAFESLTDCVGRTAAQRRRAVVMQCSSFGSRTHFAELRIRTAGVAVRWARRGSKLISVISSETKRGSKRTSVISSEAKRVSSTVGSVHFLIGSPRVLDAVPLRNRGVADSARRALNGSQWSALARPSQVGGAGAGAQAVPLVDGENPGAEATLERHGNRWAL